MLRIIHKQTVAGAILIDDIDDGMPNKPLHRMQASANPKALETDGYANKPKQACYVPRTKPSDSTVQGYIDLKQTTRVNLSAGKGKIKKLQTAGYIDVVSFVESDLVTPVVTNAQINVPGPGAVTITGTNMATLTPNVTKVLVTGTGGPLTLTQTQITNAGGSVSNTSIVIPAALVPGVAAVTTSVRVNADDKLSNIFALV